MFPSVTVGPVWAAPIRMSAKAPLSVTEKVVRLGALVKVMTTSPLLPKVPSLSQSTVSVLVPLSYCRWLEERALAAPLVSRMTSPLSSVVMMSPLGSRKMSSPAPPLSTSVPSSPLSVSLPAPPLSVSSPSPPLSESPCAVPVSMSAPPLPFIVRPPESVTADASIFSPMRVVWLLYPPVMATVRVLFESVRVPGRTSVSPGVVL